MAKNIDKVFIFTGCHRIPAKTHIGRKNYD